VSGRLVTINQLIKTEWDTGQICIPFLFAENASVKDVNYFSGCVTTSVLFLAIFAYNQ